MIKKTFFGIIAASTIALSAFTAFADDITVKVDGKTLELDQPPVISEGRTLVPFRAIFEALGAQVNWNGDSKTVTGIKGENTVSLTIGNKTMKTQKGITNLDVPAQIVNSRTLVPARAVSESLDAAVTWDANTKTVYITTANVEETDVYSTDYKLVSGNYCGYGVKMINNEIYVPFDVLPYSYKKPGDYDTTNYSIDFTSNLSGGLVHYITGAEIIHEGDRIEMGDYVRYSSDGNGFGGKLTGKAKPMPETLHVKYIGPEYEIETSHDTDYYGVKVTNTYFSDRYEEDIENAVYDIDRRYPMVNVSVLEKCFMDFEIDQTNRIIYLDKTSSGKTEEDLVSQALNSFYDNNATQHEKAAAIYNYVADHMHYAGKMTTYGVEASPEATAAFKAAFEKYSINNNCYLSAGYGVCQEYAFIFNDMCNHAGIICNNVCGVGHAWNEVYIDGKWYVVDCTLGDSASREGYFMVEPEEYSVFSENPYVTGNYMLNPESSFGNILGDF